MGPGSDWKRLFRLETSSRHIEEHIEDEFEFHIEARTEQLMEEGLSEEEARSLAQAQFGERSHYRTDCRREGEERLRRQSPGNLIDSIRRDMRIGSRVLWRSPGYAALILICLGLGIGATTSIFSVLNAVAIKRLPFEEPGRLTMVWETFWTRNIRPWSGRPSGPGTFWRVGFPTRTWRSGGSGTRCSVISADSIRSAIP